MNKLRLLSFALAAIALLSMSTSCGSVRALRGEEDADLPDAVAIATTPARLVAGDTATFTAVADVSRPHGDVIYRWDLDGLGARGTSHVDDILVGTDGEDRQITLTLADLPAGQSSHVYACSLTIEITGNNGVVTSHIYPFTVTVFSS
jgi:hypothetical protein